MKKYVFSILFALLTTMTVWAVPARPLIFTHIQKDGSKLTLQLVGDEYQHFFINTVSREKMRRGEDGDFYVMDATELGMRIQKATARRSVANQRRMARAQSPARVGTFSNMKGKKRGIVILVNFADKAMTTGTHEVFDDMFNKQGYNVDNHIGSVADYFKAQSYGQFELSFDVYGPVTLSHNMAYYGGNDSDGYDIRPAQMAKEACLLANARGADFSQYDWDGDGYVDQVFVVYAGYGENYGADSNTIWPHEWDFSSANIGKLRVDGVWVNTYACCAELTGKSGSILNGIGTAVHEFSHCLGFPDSYDIDYSGGIGMDSYDVMCSGSYNGPNVRGEVPSGYTAFQRMCAGWLTPVELSEPVSITDMPDLGSEPAAYIIYNKGNTNEFFMLENRQTRDWFNYYDYSDAGHGLFITHIDYDEAVWQVNEPNDDPSRQRLSWVPADKNYGTYSNNSWLVSSAQQKGDYFPGTKRVTSFRPSDYASYGGKWFTYENGSAHSSHELTDITENTSAGTVSFLFDGGDDAKYDYVYSQGVLTFTGKSVKWDEVMEAVLEYTTDETCVTNVDLTAVGISADDIDEVMDFVSGENILLYTTTECSIPNVVVKTGDDYYCSNLVITDEKDFAPAYSFTAASVNYTREDTQGFNAMCMPFAIPFDKVTTFFGSDAKVYTFTGIETKDEGIAYVCFDDFTSGSIEAGRPVLVCNPSTTRWSLEGVTVSTLADVQGKNKLGLPAEESQNPRAWGSCTRKLLVAGCYVLNSEGTKFVKSNETGTLTPFRFCIEIENDNPLRTELRLVE